MTAVSKDKTVRVQTDPLPESNVSNKLATYFKSELKRKSQVEEL